MIGCLKCMEKDFNSVSIPPLSFEININVGVIRVYGTAEFEENLSRNTEF